VAEAAADPASPPTRQRRRRVVSVAALVVLVVAFALALRGQWREVADAMADQGATRVLAAFLVCVIAVLMSFVLWRGVLGVLGSPVGVAVASRMFFVSQLGKYLPGSVWPLVVLMRMGREAGIPQHRSGLAFLLTLCLSVAWGLLVGLLALPALVSEGETGLIWLLLVVPVVGVLLVPRVVNAVIAATLRLMRRTPLEQSVAGRSIIGASAWTLAFWLVFGLHVWLLAVGLGADPLTTLPLAVGGFAFAFAVGPLVVVVPAGAGVREAVLILALATVLTTSEATAVALTSRALLVVTDGLLALAGLLLPRLARPR
jgi:glycosyltransferase 2 family protein